MKVREWVTRVSYSDLRLGLAVGSARALLLMLRKSGRSGGTAAPGLVALSIDPGVVTKLANRLPGGNVVVAGTNGKTTTSRLLADIVEMSGFKVIHNRSGSNLARGVAASFAEHSSVRGHPRGEASVIESDEAALPEIIRLIRPKIIVLNNLFRDQLDRYGELDAIAVKWRQALEELDSRTTLVVNVDDPTLATITSGLDAGRTCFGLSVPEHRLEQLPHAVDAATCRICGANLQYRQLYLAHLGDWLCPQCGARRPALDISGQSLTLEGARSIRMSVKSDNAILDGLNAQVPGIYNAYNVTAAVAAAMSLGIAADTIRLAVESFRSPFGRAETVRVEGRDITIALVKNPVGFNEVLRLLTSNGTGLELPTLIAINDAIADGRDVSWLWDVDFEMLARGIGLLFTAGVRGADMANRLKYAGVPEERVTPLSADLECALADFSALTSSHEHCYILPTYTAMLGIRRALANAGAVESFWRQ